MHVGYRKRFSLVTVTRPAEPAEQTRRAVTLIR
jgi:hypothetical protein